MTESRKLAGNKMLFRIELSEESLKSWSDCVAAVAVLRQIALGEQMYCMRNGRTMVKAIGRPQIV